MKIVGVKTEKGYFIGSGSDHGWNRNNFRLDNYIVNGGIEVVQSFKEGWYLIHEEVKTLEMLKSMPDINHRFELIDKDMESDKIPAVIPREDAGYYDDDGWCWNSEYALYSSMYKSASDKQESVLEPVDFEYETILETSGLIESPEYGYDIFKTQWQSDGYRKFKEGEIQHQMIDEMIFPEIVLPSRPCHLTPLQSYKIIRVYVKQNINYEYASITSDYDFCFTVKKKIPLSEKESFRVDVNNSFFQKRKRKPKYETRFRTHREIECFKMAPKPYQSYPTISGFTGENEIDLKEKIDRYCEDLIRFINQPVVDCPHCSGRGVTEIPEAPTPDGKEND